jgi:hypothetical protein
MRPAIGRKITPLEKVKEGEETVIEMQRRLSLPAVKGIMATLLDHN